MLAKTALLSLLSLLAFPLAAPAPLLEGLVTEDNAAAFAQELVRVQSKMEQGKWKSARVQLQRALESHADRAYVLGSLGEIELCLSRCVFWESRADVDVAGYFEGELLSYSQGSGKIKLRYEEQGPHDFVQRGLALVFAVDFSGPYTIEIEDGSSPSLVVCASGGNQIQVNYGRVFNLGRNHPGHGEPTQRWCQINSTLVDADGERVNAEERKDFTSKPNLKSAKYEVSVTDRQVKTSFDGKRLLSFKKPAELWGTIALPPGGPHGTITISGDASHWLERKRDEVFEAGWKEFEESWKLAEHLPDWMNTALEAPAAPATTGARGKQPSELSQELIGLWNDAVRALEAKDYAQAIARSKELLEREPDLVQAGHLEAQAWIASRKKDEALRVLGHLVERFPGHRDSVLLLARLQLVSGRFEEVQRTVQAAVAAGISPADLQQISVTAGKGLHGPTWGQKHEYESRHYRVASDLSREVCRSVALELEETYRYVSRRLGTGEHDESRKFQVYAFAGRASYLDYIEDVFEGRGESTQGMYSSYLKQLLVLDSEPRASFEHTVRHEGFHQFLDSILDQPPIWLNEGLAEYYAASRTPQGSWRDGRLNEMRMGTLRGGGRDARLLPLAELFELEQPAFMADGARCYAQAWAFVHFLEHSSVQNRDRLERLIQSLLEGATHAEAIERAFGDVQLTELDAQLAEHIEKL